MPSQIRGSPSIDAVSIATELSRTKIERKKLIKSDVRKKVSNAYSFR